jgi:hypothetical protein
MNKKIEFTDIIIGLVIFIKVFLASPESSL